MLYDELCATYAVSILLMSLLMFVISINNHNVSIDAYDVLLLLLLLSTKHPHKLLYFTEHLLDGSHV